MVMVHRQDTTNNATHSTSNIKNMADVMVVVAKAAVVAVLVVAKATIKAVKTIVGNSQPGDAEVHF